MRTLPKPDFTVEEVFRACISRVRDRDLQSRFEACIPEIVQDALDFDSKAAASQLHTIPKKTIINLNVSKEEMEKVYVDRMVNKKSPGRKFYEKLRYPITDDKCPLCGQRPASTLDHYLAKSDYPSLAVTPTNLVPACKDCNFIKLNSFPSASEEETLHPYFDSIDEERWVYAKVIQTSPPSVRYYINPPISASLLQAERVKYHFKLYELDKLFASEAATELSDIEFQLNKLIMKGGPIAVQKHLYEAAESCAHNRINSWKTAMYYAIANDEWYCSTGINQ